MIQGAGLKSLVRRSVLSDVIVPAMWSAVIMCAGGLAPMVTTALEPEPPGDETEWAWSARGSQVMPLNCTSVMVVSAWACQVGGASCTASCITCRTSCTRRLINLPSSAGVTVFAENTLFQANCGALSKPSVGATYTVNLCVSDWFGCECGPVVLGTYSCNAYSDLVIRNYTQGAIQ